MRKTFIQRTQLWFIIKRKFEDEDWVARITLFRTWKKRENKRECAKVYFFEDEALSWLMIARRW